MKTKTKDITNFDMNAEVYALRRRVMQFIYEVKKTIPTLPRVEVRIGTSKKKEVLGQARLSQRVIWITDKALDMNDDKLRNIVYHELLHAICGTEHDTECPLMEPELNTVLDKNDCLKYFTKHYRLITATP